MNLKEIMHLQKEFDLQHEGRIPFFSHISDNDVTPLEHLLVCLMGEVGEVANLVKKAVRGDYDLSQIQPSVAEELADVFIYLIKICNQFDIDLEKEFMSKLQRNWDRFKEYETAQRE